MPAQTSKQIDQQTRDKVNRIDQRVEELVLPALESLQSQLSKLSVVSVAEFADYKSKTDVRIAELERQVADAAPAIKFIQALNSRWVNLLVGALILGAILTVVSQIGKLGIQI